MHFPVRNTTFPYPWIPMAGFREFQALAKKRRLVFCQLTLPWAQNVSLTERNGKLKMLHGYLFGLL